ILDRDENAAKNILQKGLATAGHVGSLASDSENAWGEDVRLSHFEQSSTNQESHAL
ncbi:MAG: transposase, partial [Deinococcota bacterium]|nr:transposase [Deinococcota bacterium]